MDRTPRTRSGNNMDIHPPVINDDLSAVVDGLHAFQRIDIEYHSLYRKISPKHLLHTIRMGLNHKLLQTSIDRDRANQWLHHFESSLTTLAKHIRKDILAQNRSLPVIGLQNLSDDPQALRKQLQHTPNDHLCHFQLAWIFANNAQLDLAERHFNVSALQSHSVNPSFASYAFRHLADIRYRKGKFTQALLAIESARELCCAFCSELQFEYVRMLCAANRTTQALQQFTILLTKVPYYEVLAQCDPVLIANPSIHRYLSKLRQQHQQNITNNLLLAWEDDPLRLLNLDQEFGHKDSLESLRAKQQHTLENMPLLLLQDEATASQYVQQQSRHFVMNTLDVKKQGYIQQIEKHQWRARRVHGLGQWLVYASVVGLMALALSYGISTLASLFSYYWPVNQTVQSLVLVTIGAMGTCGMVLLHFSPKQLSRLLKQKHRLEQISHRLGASA